MNTTWMHPICMHDVSAHCASTPLTHLPSAPIANARSRRQSGVRRMALAAALLLGLGHAHAATGEHAAHGDHAHEHQHGSAIGLPGDAAKVSRTLEVVMSDTMRFTPEHITVKRGETIRFVIKNAGQLKHEFNLGSAADLKKHYAMMLKFPEMEHDDPNVASVEPGKSSEVVWKFTTAGTVAFACLYPGHYAAGMKGTVKVSNH